MNKLIQAIKSAPKRAGLIAVTAGVVLIPAVLFAWGPSRPTYTMEVPADHVTFNSITNNPNQGDEREFVSVSDLTAGGSLANSVSLVPGHEYKVQIYIHNNAASNLNASGKGIATGTKVQSKLPKSVNGTAKIAGYVYADNATPKEVYDTAELKSDKNVDLEVVSGSVYLSTHAIDQNLSNNLVTVGDAEMPVGGGVLVGSSALNGKWYGCMEYAGVVVYKFRVKETNTPAVTIDKSVSKSSVSVNESFVYTLNVANTGDVDLKNVHVTDSAPAGITFQSADKGTIANNAWSYVVPSLKKGEHVTAAITAVAKSYIEGEVKNTACVDATETTKSPDACDSASVTITKTETPVTPTTPSELPTTGPADAFVGVVGIGVLVSAALYYIQSRRSL